MKNAVMLIYYYYYYYLIELQMGFYPVAVVPQQNATHKDIHITHNNTTPRQNAAHKATQTTNTLHTMTTQTK
jgi:hypothetical protein